MYVCIYIYIYIYIYSPWWPEGEPVLGGATRRHVPGA